MTYLQEIPGSASHKVEDIDANHAGPRKLIRPMLAETIAAKRVSRRRDGETLLAHHELAAMQSVTAEGSHAEAFYFQKQMQSQTLMIFVIENGQQIEGYIEWYDRHAIKVRHGSLRVLLYKSCIKYLYKAMDIPGSL